MSGQQPEERRAWVGVVNIVLAKLQDGELKPGDCLPSQRAARWPACMASDSRTGNGRTGIPVPSRTAHRAAHASHRHHGGRVHRRRRPSPLRIPRQAAPGRATSMEDRPVIAGMCCRFGVPGDTRHWVRVANDGLGADRGWPVHLGSCRRRRTPAAECGGRADGHESVRAPGSAGRWSAVRPKHAVKQPALPGALRQPPGLTSWPPWTGLKERHGDTYEDAIKVHLARPGAGPGTAQTGDRRDGRS